MIRSLLLLVAMAACSVPATGQISVLDTFNPSQSGSLCGLGTDPTTGNTWVYQCSSATIEGYTPTGIFITAFPRPGESANDVDIEFAPAEMNLAGATIPEGTMLFINGETGVAEIYAIDTATGAVLATLVTAFGASHVVGGGYSPVRDTFFLIQDRVAGGGADNRVGEIDPVTGAVLNAFAIGGSFDVNFGDLDVSAGTGRLFLTSSIETSLGEFTPTGAFVTTHALPAGVSGLSGLGLDCALQQAWVASTAGTVWKLGNVPCGAASGVGNVAVSGFALQPNFPDPFTDRTDIRFTLPRPAQVRLAVHDLRGRLVRELVNASLPAGAHTAGWNGTDESRRPLPSGAYFYRLTVEGVTVTQSAVLVR